MKLMSWTEAGHGIKEALQGCQELRINVIMVIICDMVLLLFPEDQIMKDAFSTLAVAFLGYTWESLKMVWLIFERIE